MEVKGMVNFYDDEPRAGTYLIAKGFLREHKKVLKVIKKYSEKFETLGPLSAHKFKSTGGRPVEEFLLNEPQATFLGTLFKNQNDVVVNFKLSLVQEFYRMKNAIIRAKAQQQNVKGIEARQTGKVARLIATDAMKQFEEYATSQGSKNANRYYMNITKMMNSLLFIVEGKFKNLRDLMTPLQLMTVSSAEQIIDKALKDGMKNKMFYKDIYKLVKERVQLFADLHGQSEIMSKQLSLFE